MSKESITLYFKEGPSDKVYQASIEESGGGFVVNFAFGRRGSTMQTGTKTAAPVPFEKAKAIYDKLVGEKMAKGYTPGADGTPYQNTSKEERVTGMIPQLPNPIEEAEAERLLDDPDYWAQEKKDGKHVMVRKDAKGVTGSNRKGLAIDLPESVAKTLESVDGDFEVDGEAVGIVYYLFDCLKDKAGDVREQPYSRRYGCLSKLLAIATRGPIGPYLIILPVAKTSVEKRALYAKLKKEGKEGVVFKRHDAPYKPGRPASGGSMLKFKFYATASVIVAKVNAGKRSVAIEVLDGGKRVGIGNVTIPPNKEIPKAGAIIETRYLYAYPSGSLYQPTYLGERDDIDTNACLESQLKYKAEEDLG